MQKEVTQEGGIVVDYSVQKHLNWDSKYELLFVAHFYSLRVGYVWSFLHVRKPLISSPATGSTGMTQSHLSLISDVQHWDLGTWDSSWLDQDVIMISKFQWIDSHTWSDPKVSTTWWLDLHKLRSSCLKFALLQGTSTWICFAQWMWSHGLLDHTGAFHNLIIVNWLWRFEAKHERSSKVSERSSCFSIQRDIIRRCFPWRGRLQIANISPLVTCTQHAKEACTQLCRVKRCFRVNHLKHHCVKVTLWHGKTDILFQNIDFIYIHRWRTLD